MINSGHWYKRDGTPFHFVPRADGTGTRPTTLADARKWDLLPSVTTILKATHKPGLQDWLIRQAVYAVTTAPDVKGESLDAKITRVLETERQQDEEAAKARELGTDMHAALETLFSGGQIDDDLRPWIEPCYQHLRKCFSDVQAVEIVLCGDCYAGKADLIIFDSLGECILDFKTTKKLPEKNSWPEHRLQLAAYAKAYYSPDKHVSTANCYISTAECGKFALFRNTDWEMDYEMGFAPLLKYWQWANNYWPSPEPATIEV